MSGAALAAALALALAPGGPDLKDLQGAWTGHRWTEGRGEDPKTGAEVSVVIKDALLSFRKGSNGSLVGEATITLGDGTLDATGTTGGYRNKTYLGLLKLEGDTLTWVSNGTAGKTQKRPDSYQADPGSARYLIILKRAKP